MQSDDFDQDSALRAAEALAEVLKRRTHRRKVMGQVMVVPGQLGDALKLPDIMNRLSGKTQRRRASGLNAFQELWETLSESTRIDVLNELGWYDPEDLDWDDKRSNRRPTQV